MRRRNQLATTRRDPTPVRFIKSAIKGKKYTILIIRDIGFLKIEHFNRIFESLPGLSQGSFQCVWTSLRNKDLLNVWRKEIADDGAVRLNEKGEDTLSILMQLVAFGSIPEDAARDGMKAAGIDDWFSYINSMT